MTDCTRNWAFVGSEIGFHNDNGPERLDGTQIEWDRSRFSVRELERRVFTTSRSSSLPNRRSIATRAEQLRRLTNELTDQHFTDFFVVATQSVQ